MRAPLTPPSFQRWTMSDGYVIRGRLWPPSRPEAGLVMYLHGIQSHGGWFEWSASVLANCGAGVILPDRRGSGLNQEARGDTPSAERWLKDLDELACWGGAQFGDQPLDLVGVSWGGKLAAAWAMRLPRQVRRLLLIAPGVFPAVDVGPWERLRIGLALLTDCGRSFTIPLEDPALFTDNPPAQEFIACDPLRLTRATARFFWHSRRLERWLARRPRGSLRPETTLLLAGRDRIIRNQRTERWIRRVAATGPRVEHFPDYAHTLEFSAHPERFAEVLGNWARAGRRPAAKRN